MFTLSVKRVLFLLRFLEDGAPAVILFIIQKELGSNVDA